MGEIPNYRAVGHSQSFNYQAFLGVDKYFFTQVTNLMWYVGARGLISHGYSEVKYDEYTSMGKSAADSWNGRVSIVAGVDYYLTPSLSSAVRLMLVVGYTIVHHTNLKKVSNLFRQMLTIGHSFQLLPSRSDLSSK